KAVRDSVLGGGDRPATTASSAETATPSVGVPNPIDPTGLAAGATTDGGAAAQVIPITLADLGLAVILLVATVIGFRNVPGLLEIVVLQRLPLDAGSRYALSTVLRYLIAMIGIALAFGAIHVSWANVQWLAAALTFGLAFGLQEIFANFISGLIILAERPIRIGDTVTVGQVSGTVTRIKMRATTISDWDRKELVIPNKSFITGDIINWSLSDPMLRIIIPVGVAYGSDLAKVERTLLRIAGENRRLLDDPKPFVHFAQFGDSTLNFELRGFIPSIEHLIPVRHELRMAIAKAFRKADIEIAFPQRDLHVRSIGDLKQLMVSREEAASEQADAPL
ncbi:MAG: mechanosensitive ion channel domain-containing protein, partial [Planctomycetota bacterium]